MFPILLLSHFLILSTAHNPSEDRNLYQTYIVHVHPPTTFLSDTTLSKAAKTELYYHSFLPPTLSSVDNNNDSPIIYSYHNTVSGFAARLTKSDMLSVKSKSGFLHAYPDNILKIHTTHTPQFLGLNRSPTNLWNESSLGRGVIIGVLDTGILPTHPSFNDQNIPAPPPKWKGKCEFPTSICNNKLIGARVFLKGVNGTSDADTPIDVIGHGSHTSSTAAGSFVPNVGVLGLELGTAAGMAPMAHVAMYRVCRDENCATSDILAGMDAAVGDGVDIISVSLGGADGSKFYENGIAMGAFGAVEKGVFVCASAGNFGPGVSTLANDAPWILTVGASTNDQFIQTTVQLGNGEKLVGKSLFQSNVSGTMLPLVYPGLTNANAAFCNNGSLDGIDITGKVVLCDLGGLTKRISKGDVVKNAGGTAMILANSPDRGFTIQAEAHKLPASHVTYIDGLKIKSYINLTLINATALIIPERMVIKNSPASPMVGSFSSRGPSLLSKGILKPDIIGPGIDILAAWPNISIGPSPVGSMFNVISGTSMSAPHLSGIAALLKSVHPDWSPAMIRSAIMTTAETVGNLGEHIVDHTGSTASAFAVGAGHVDPVKASRPGLVYNIKPEDYISYMCGLSMTNEQVSMVARRKINCSLVPRIDDVELNYPSFFVSLGVSNNFTRSVGRSVMNVGEANSSYVVEVVVPEGVMVKVIPMKLEFRDVNEVQKYYVEFSGSGCNDLDDGFCEGALAWVAVNGTTRVRSPVIVAFK